MKVIIDDKIPYIKGAIEALDGHAEVEYLPGISLSPSDIKDADALIVRTRTKCDKNLLEGSKVRFIATATIGYDHIDTEYCNNHGIYWTNCPGCNSESVAQYIYSSLLLLQKEKNIDLNDTTLGIVGVGHVGSKIAEIGKKLGMNILLCDPPRAYRENSLIFTSFDEITKQSDIITFHTPLTHIGNYPTYHMADKKFFDSVKKDAIIINTSRGAVIDNSSLLEAITIHNIKGAILDVWENEPNIMLPLLEKVFIGTPHIAGYAADGKANATRMSLEAFCEFFNYDPTFQIIPPAPENPEIHASSESDALLQIYNPLVESDQLKTYPDKFEWFRGNYPVRRQSSAYKIIYHNSL